MAHVIEIEGLRREYRARRRRIVAVGGLDLAVPEGGVFGFLGPNGSGKTTTIRCLLGLVRPSAGRLCLLGRPIPQHLPDSLRRVGAIVEGPALFPTMTGRENLRLLAAVDRIPHRRVDEVLETVGLGDRAGDLTGGYSLGMRQRLALAAALLKDPALLVLDEPANGLDPAGIRQVRELVRQLAREGRTVFESSHLLSEIEQTCDRVAIIDRGRTVAQGTVAEVLAAAGHRAALRVRFDARPDTDRAVELLRAAGLDVREHDGHLRIEAANIGATELNELLGRRGLWAAELRAEHRTLEELFLELTGPARDGRREKVAV
jgi:ABC-2 type transport system ATP-binding protein